MRMAREACELVARKARARGRMRVWVPACKTGSTAYTLSMLLLEAARPLPPLELMLFATDTNERALALARAGRYPAGAALGMDPCLRAHYTFDEGPTLRVSEPLRERCVFSRHDLGCDPPFPRLDLIVCHHVFQGVVPSKRAELARRLHRGLRHDGLLLAFDHPECFPLDFFEPVGGGCFRPRAQPRPIRPRLPAGDAPLHDVIAERRRRLASARAALVPWPPAAFEAYGDASDFVRTLGHPLVVCDAQMRVILMSVEAQRLFELREAGQTLELAALDLG
jgi:SAM-dependent methyltransferase